MTTSAQSVQDTIVQEFEAFPDWDARYKYLIELGKSLPAFPEEYRTEENKVKGCQSQVWMHAYMDDDRMMVKADSDALIVSGLIALLLRVFSGHTPQTILATEPEFFERLGMGQHISMQRSNGLAAMIKQIKLYALVFQMQQQQTA